MDERQKKILHTCIGLGKLTAGAVVLRYYMNYIRNTDQNVWTVTALSLAGAMVTHGLLHLSLAWSMDPPDDDRPPNGGVARPNGGVARPPNGGVARPPNGGVAPRVGIPLAENERGDPGLAVEGHIIHQNFPPIAVGIRDAGKANLHDAGEARPANFEAGERRVGSGGLLRREPVQQAIAYEEGQEIGDNNEFDPDNALEEVGQADDVEESNQADNEGELGQDTDESESSNVVNESGLSQNVGETEPTNEVHVAGHASNIDEVNMADSLEDIAECADKDDSTHECESDIELPRSSIGLSLDIPSIKFIDSSESDCESSY